MDDQREPMDTDMVMVPRKLLLEVCDTAEEDSLGHEGHALFDEYDQKVAATERVKIDRLRAYAEGDR